MAIIRIIEIKLSLHFFSKNKFIFFAKLVLRVANKKRNCCSFIILVWKSWRFGQNIRVTIEATDKNELKLGYAILKAYFWPLFSVKYYVVCNLASVFL